MPNKTHIIQIRATANQFNRIKNNAQAKGFSSVSAYLRDISLKNNLILEQQIAEIHKTICQNKNQSSIERQNKSKPSELGDYAMSDEYNPSPSYGEI